MLHDPATPVTPPAPASCEGGSTNLQSSSLHVVLVEDNVINCAVATGLLENRGHHLTHAANGAAAVEAARDESVNLIFMDIQMLDMDGPAAARRIREREAGTGRHVPIVAMTSHAIASDRERCLAAGMDEYLSKPLTKDQLLRLLDSIPRPHALAAILPNAVVPAGPAEHTVPEGAAIFSREKLLDQLEGDEYLLAKMAELFEKYTPQLLDDIRSAVARRKGEDLARSAYTLLGTFSAFGASKAHGLAQCLEEMGLRSIFTKVEAHLAMLERETDRVQVEVAQLTCACA
jgi:CheY-like chemotaxis protein